MIVSFERLYKISTFFVCTLFLSNLIKNSDIIFAILMTISFLHDILGIGFVIPAQNLKLLILKAIKPKIFKSDFKPQWEDFACVFVGFFLGSIYFKNYFISLILFSILFLFAIITRINQNIRK